ncbi:NodT family efflux transporter outer membrane factor (OMF) lipoprotein [Variovorax paradoxus]|uniref:efflux transporter outer membrane subunit n=1 Tax=Variovorax paradoxus TaxID=34073 RepID=UPI002784FBD9|nr:efflux transporter outer membrane subunit [Variovorax paradoxus]MDQ0027539.1 NodT family efflux transporter outer membrane factor (OMF) lipoprotein [Variovorax paradoxus]
MRLRYLVAAGGAALLAAGCAVGPDYKAPETPLPVSWKLEEPWRQSTPNDSADKGPWWKRFGDAQLDALQDQALGGSPTLAIANARLAQARATLAANSASRFPQLGLGTRASRLKISANRPLTNYATANSSTVQNDFMLSLNASYELDLAGRVQRSVEGATASAEQSAADLENTRLVLTADVANNYFNLRSTDIELDVLSRSIALQRRALELVTARHDLGAVSGLDVAQQQALLDTTLTQVDVLKKQRAQYEHALATLTGTPAPSFALPADLREIRPPPVPLGVPSEMLQRRPDVASAERAMAAANAQIGVATAAFYPSFIISPTVGVDSRMIETLFNGPSLLWSVGVSATQVLFDGGRVRANVDFAKAGYDATVGNYRRTVLTAMQEVEDGITGLASLDRATTQAQAAVAAARRVLDMATSRYEGGASTYLDVITAQQSLLTVERQAAQLQGQRLLTSVFLVKALGGDWCGAGAPDSVDPRTGCPAPLRQAAGTR